MKLLKFGGAKAKPHELTQLERMFGKKSKSLPKVSKTAKPTSYAKELVRNKAKEESNTVPSVIGSTEGSLPIDAMAKKKAEVAKATEDLKPKKTKPQLTEYAQSLIDKKQGREPLKDTGF